MCVMQIQGTSETIFITESMINSEQDILISRLTVRIREESSEAVIGTGLIYYSDDLRDKVYIITASHCLHNDGDSLKIYFLR